MVREQQANHKLKKGKTEVMLFGTVKRLHSKKDLKLWMNNHLIHFASRYKYLGVFLEPSLNMKERLQTTLKSAAVRITLLKRMRQSPTSHAAEVIYRGNVLTKMLNCSSPTLKISETMGTKFEKIQARAVKSIYLHPEYDQEHNYMTILNQKKFKADLLIFKCLQGTNVQNCACHGERVNHNYGARRNKTTLRIPRFRTEAGKSPCSKVQLALMNYQLTFEA